MITGRIRMTFIYPDQSTLLQANRQVANRSKSPIVAKRTRSPYFVRALVEVAVSEWITQDEAESMLILPSRIPSHQDPQEKDTNLTVVSADSVPSTSLPFLGAGK
jgi:hypothetical protein